MPPICPGPCGRLATAAIFLSIGVVQFIVGIILLRSKYVFLLAGPDFWTSACNIAVGCLLGVSASVWKESRKRLSKKHFIRRHLQLALVFSGLIMNATTLGILLLVEDNTLLSIRLESNGNYSKTTFDSEILAYAYVASVCCPVVCIVVSILLISGICFSSAKGNSKERKCSMNSLKKDRSRSLQWIYTAGNLDSSENKPRSFVLPSTSESSSDDDTEIAIRQKHTDPMEELQSVLTRMAQGKRDSILSDSAVMLRQLDLRRKNRYNSLNQDGSYMGPVLMRETILSERPEKASTGYNSHNSKRENLEKYSSEYDECARLPPEDINSKRIKRSRNRRPDTRHVNPYDKEFIEYQDTPQSNAKNAFSQNANFKGNFHTRHDVDNILGCSSDVIDCANRITGKKERVEKKSRKLSRTETEPKVVFTGNNKRKRDNEFFQDHHQMVYESAESYHEANKREEISPDLNACFSPNGSEFSADSTFDLSRTSSWAGEVVPISVTNSSVARLPPKLIPVASPIVPNAQQVFDLRKISNDSGISSIHSNSFNNETANQNEVKDRKSILSSFRECTKKGNKENMQEYPKIGTQSAKKYDLSKVVTMAAISEEPHLELNHLEPKLHSSSLCETATPQTSKGYFRQQSLPSEFSPSSSKEARQGNENITRDTPKRKRSASGKALRKLWSVATSDSQIDFLDQVVDGDSLIGLSEEELIARQLKNRALRKVVQQRIKEEMML